MNLGVSLIWLKFKNLLLLICTNLEYKNIKSIDSNARKMDLKILDVKVMPNVKSKKYMVNSSGLLTGCLNLMIDRAPTIPKDNAILPEITSVITRPIKGNKQYVIILEKDFAQY